jgi:membrane protease YdiL (CAAX protease family)
LNRAIVVFLAVAYGLSIFLGALVGLTGGHESRFAGLSIATMFIPAVAVLATRLTTGERLRVVGSRFSPRYLPIALLLIPVTLHAIMLPLVVSAVGSLPWQEWLTPQPDGWYHAPAVRGWGALTASALGARVALNAGVGLVVVSFLAFFEEVGWRAWLLPRLVDRTSVRSAIIITAVVWGGWHVPFALSGIQHVDGISPAGLALVVPFGSIAAGLIIGWLWVRTESIWIVAIAHGSLNNWGQYAFKFMRELAAPSPSVLLGAGFLGVFVVGSCLVAFALPPASRLQQRARRV